MVDADPVNPMRIVWELSQRLPDDAIVTADSGSVANWYAKVLRMRRADAAARCPARSPRWAPGCRTRSAPSSPTPTGRRSR